MSEQNGVSVPGRPAAVEADTGIGAPETGAPPGQPALKLEVKGVRAIEHAAAPTLSFTLDVTDASGREVFMTALSVQILLEPTKRSYDEETKARLVELFGEPHRWAATGQRTIWTSESVLIGAFTGSTTVEIPVLCNYDLELAATKYFHSVEDGEVPLAFHFNGGVYYREENGGLQVVQISWDTVADFKMPLEVWRGMIDSYYPFRGWLPLHRDTLARLEAHKARRGLPSLDATVDELLSKDASDDR